jgi:ABC-type cobalamin/Fe3+-siderophores transport system ATPase subunit
LKTHLTIQNYRCFVAPATIELDKGFTAFVGVNNAGKSALMRFLVELRPFFRQLAPDANFLAALREQPAISGRPWPGFDGFEFVRDPQEVFSFLNEREIQFWFDFSYDAPPSYLQPTKVTFTIARDLTWRVQVTTTDGTLNNLSRESIRFDGNQLCDGPNQKCDLSELFPLTTRLRNTMYVGPFRNAINVGGTDNYFDVQVGQPFIRQFRQMKTGNSLRDNQAILRLTDEIRKIFEFETLTIDASADETTLHIIVNGRPYKQQALGAGLIQFILVLANASVRLPELILIDEPELNLHPRLQLDFLTTLASYTREGVWFSTHSIGLARASGQRVYSVTRRGDGNSTVRALEATPRLSEFLGEMGFSSHKELGFERLLLVEGPTEVTTFQQILRAMGKDHKIVLLPLHGRMPQAIDLEEILRITTGISAIIDSERTQAGAALRRDRQEFVDLCADRRIPCKVLERRATENYFPDSVIKEVFGNRYRALGSFEKLEDLKPNWSKGDNWRLARFWPLKDIVTTDLGRFLEAL